jgi:tRNA threonylcarbamoyladenosine biosynthesis protein TsaE
MARELHWRARSRAPETTEAVGEAMARALPPGALVGLVGELGSGKTTLVRGIARGLEVRDLVTSPTFTRLRVLEGRLLLHHFDAWRSGAEALFEEGAELLSGDGVGVVEWADRVEALLPRPRIEFTLAHRGETERELGVYLWTSDPAERPAGEALARGLRAALERARTTAGLAILSPP